MNAHKTKVTLTQNGKIVLEGLPFQAGDAVEVIILERPTTIPTATHLSHSSANDLYPLRGKVIRYDDPFEPAVSVEDWDVMQ
jgi:hypothetical protein